MRCTFALLGFVALTTAAPAIAQTAPPTRELERINWMGQGYPKFDLAKARQYYAAVNDKIAKLVIDVIKPWDAMGL